jgi:hypothetical protein
MSEHAASGVAVPLDLVAVATRVVVEHVEAEFGQPVVGRLVSQDVIERLRPGRLHTSGPVVHRQVQLVDAEPPHRHVAACWALIVLDRLPDAVRAELGCGEPLDRLLTRHGTGWRGELLAEEGLLTPAAEASVDLSWLDPAGVVVELVRLASIGEDPVAVLIDEVPLRFSPSVAAPA